MSVDEPFDDIIVMVYASVAKEGPPTAYLFGALQVDIDNGCGFAVAWCFVEQFTLRAGNKRGAPELYSVGLFAGVWFVAGTIDGHYG
mgnify:CR=1 FL=1